MSAFSLKRPDKSYKGINHQKYVTRITKTLYYGKFPKTDRLSLPVTELAAELFSEAHRGKSLERLHLDTASTISRNACVSPCSFILAMLYLDRLKSCNPDYLERTSPSDLFLVSLMISSKYLFDDGESDEVFMDEWAASGGITVSELVQLEREFLKAIDWEIYVKEIMFWKKLNYLEGELANKEGKRRGFFTYTELMNLSTVIEIQLLVQYVVTVTMILIATYTAGVLTIAGSFYLVSYIPGNALHCGNGKFLENPKLDISKIQVCLNNTETDAPKMIGTKNIESLHIIKTSLFLASINTFMAPYCNNSDKAIASKEDNTEAKSWEWWNIPSMIWLSEISADIYNIEELIGFRYLYKYFIGYLELLFVSSNNLETGNHVNMNKATKTRIQDQLEGSWHKEWTDSLEKGFFCTPYVPNIKLQ